MDLTDPPRLIPLTLTTATATEVGAGPCSDETCCAPSLAHPADAERDTGWHRAAATARTLSWLSLAWMSAEGVLGLIAGTRAGSISLIGWALGSVIEGLASIIVIWRFTGSRTLSATAEQRATRAVAVSFFLLAPYLAVQSVRDLCTGATPTSTTLGILVTATSLLLMPALGLAKRRLGTRLRSGATTGEGIQNLLCAAQAGAVLLALVLNAVLGWSWIDPAAGIVLAAVAVHEGRSAWKGDDCC